MTGKSTTLRSKSLLQTINEYTKMIILRFPTYVWLKSKFWLVQSIIVEIGMMNLLVVISRGASIVESCYPIKHRQVLPEHSWRYIACTEAWLRRSINVAVGSTVSFTLRLWTSKHRATFRSPHSSRTNSYTPLDHGRIWRVRSNSS